METNEKYIRPEMTAAEMAYVIFYNMDLLVSCKIEGVENFNGKWKPKGEIVCDLLWEYDRKFNVREKSEHRIRRKPPQSIGGYLADKIFRWKYEIIDNDVKYSIWRIQ